MASPSLYGGTYNLFHYTFPKLGIEVSFVEDPDDPESWRAAVRPSWSGSPSPRNRWQPENATGPGAVRRGPLR